VFRKFAVVQSIRQLHLWLRQEQIRLPALAITDDGPRLVWKLPVYNTIRNLLTNPIYGGAVRPELPRLITPEPWWRKA
jgi:hypothetical protein